MVAAILWLGLAMWLFFGEGALLPLGSVANDIFAWAFVTLAFIPMLQAMDTEITHEMRGHSWKSWGEEPKPKNSSEYEDYRRKLYNKTRRR